VPAGGEGAKKRSQAQQRNQGQTQVRRATSDAAVTSLLRWWRSQRPGRRVSIAALVTVAAAAVVTLILWPASKPPTVDNGRYLAFSGCLLTGWQGQSGQLDSAAWTGLEDAAAATRMQVHYLAVPAGAPSAAPYLAGLAEQRCGVVVAAGAAEAQAVSSDAHLFADVRFVVVGGSASGPNVQDVHGPAADIAAQVKSLAIAVQQSS
jgi:hypothetical protein